MCFFILASTQPIADPPSPGLGGMYTLSKYCERNLLALTFKAQPPTKTILPLLTFNSAISFNNSTNI